ncbi:telomeric repeat-binding factor 1-like, partial [Myotis lucifugus]|uniref:telomeric repeat-binding factor 1-like n=1 Tax=Myotis lucifugus TaxID=59463 RepID=UPI000CCC2A8B
MVISQKDTFHSFFQHFSYSHMMEKIKSFVNYVLDEKSSTFLMKAAAKVVESKRARTTVSQDNDVDMETQANLEVCKSVNNKPSAVTESSQDTISLMRSHKNLFLSKAQYGCQSQDFNEKEKAETLISEYSYYSFRSGKLMCSRKRANPLPHQHSARTHTSDNGNTKRLNVMTSQSRLE